MHLAKFSTAASFSLHFAHSFAVTLPLSVSLALDPSLSFHVCMGRTERLVGGCVLGTRSEEIDVGVLENR